MTTANPQLYAAIQSCIATHGSLTAAARHLGLNKSYLSRLRSGVLQNPSQDLCRQLGVQRVISYPPLEGQ
jgi:hypothetical protein